jgi:hypothetical protein
MLRKREGCMGMAELRSSGVVLALGLAACGTSGGENPSASGVGDGVATMSESGPTTAAETEGASTSASASDSGEFLDVAMTSTESGTADADGGDGDCDGVEPPTPTAQVVGTVYAPNLEIPISGALVYLTTGEVDPVPDGVYCAECVSLPCDAHFALSAADGSFVLPAVDGAQKLVVQKGQFLHVTDFDVQTGNNIATALDSSLPGEWNPDAGMWIPRIVVGTGGADQIANLLAKVGLGEADVNGQLVPGTENFVGMTGPELEAMLDDPTMLDDNHIVFASCFSVSANGPIADQRLENIRDYVEAGGKWYATDYANDWIEEPFPNYQVMHGEPAAMDVGAYDVDATVLDPDMLAWLEAMPAPLKDIGNGAPTLNDLPLVRLEGSFTGVDETPEILVQNEEGEDVNVGHYVWAEGPCGGCSDNGVRAMSMTATYGCGRLMFSTYHANQFLHEKLTPQELMLLYTILEIGVCFDEPPPPPPPID